MWLWLLRLHAGKALSRIGRSESQSNAHTAMRLGILFKLLFLLAIRFVYLLRDHKRKAMIYSLRMEKYQVPIEFGCILFIILCLIYSAMELLIKHYADVNAQNDAGKTA